MKYPSWICSDCGKKYGRWPHEDHYPPAPSAGDAEGHCREVRSVAGCHQPDQPWTDLRGGEVKDDSQFATGGGKMTFQEWWKANAYKFPQADYRSSDFEEIACAAWDAARYEYQVARARVSEKPTPEVGIEMIEAACESLLSNTGADISGDAMREALEDALAAARRSATRPTLRLDQSIGNPGTLPREAYASPSDKSARSFPICKDHQTADWNEPSLDDEACVLCRLFYLEAQESLLEDWQQRAKRAEDAIAEMQRPLDAQMARLNATVTTLNDENVRLRMELEKRLSATRRVEEPKEYPHYQAAFINAIADEGTKAEAIEWLQKTWNELMWVRHRYSRG